MDGAALVDWLTSPASAGYARYTTAEHSSPPPLTPAAADRSAAVELGQRLMDARLLSSVDASEPFADSPALFRLADHAAAPVPYPRVAPAALNARRRWRGAATAARPAREVAAALRGRITALYDRFLSEDGRDVDYAGMRGSPEFAAYVEATGELQVVDLYALSKEERTAFFINVYNALVVHVTAAVGPPGGFLDRLTFFARYTYDIAGGAPLRLRPLQRGFHWILTVFRAPISLWMCSDWILTVFRALALGL